MVSPFVGYEDERLRRRRLALAALLRDRNALVGGPQAAVEQVPTDIEIVEDPQSTNPFARYVRDPIARFSRSISGLDPRPRVSPDAGLLDRLLPGFRQLATPTLPEQIVTRAPGPLQPAARVVRDVSSPLGLATLPLGGSPRVIAGGLAGAMGGATAGQSIGGNVC